MYGVSIRFRFGFFKYPFYSRVLVLLVLLYTKLKLLLSLGRYSSWGRFIGFNRNSRSLVDISRIFISVEFGRILRLVESGGFLRCRVDISRSFILVGVSSNLTFIEFSRIPRLVESSRFLRYRIEIGRNLRLVDLSRFSRF